MDIQGKVAALEKRVQELEATEAIRNTIARYAWAVDKKDWTDMEAIFTDDAVVENKWRNETYKGKEAVLHFFRQHRETFTFTHRISTGNEQITVTGKTGLGVSYCISMLAFKGESYVLGGRYQWHMRFEHNTWRIAKFVNEVPLMGSLEKGWGQEEAWHTPPPPLNEAR
jgi:ketosteroid isomerase-like protein